MEEADPKKYLSEILGMYKYKVDNNLCTLGEMNGVIKSLQSNMDLDATIKDMAEWFNKPEVNVRVAINRNVMPKPKRRVMYSFKHFLKIVPKSWLKSN